MKKILVVLLSIVLLQLLNFGLYSFGLVERYRPIIQVDFRFSGSAEPTEQEGDQANGREQ